MEDRSRKTIGDIKIAIEEQRQFIVEEQLACNVYKEGLHKGMLAGLNMALSYIVENFNIGDEANDN